LVPTKDELFGLVEFHLEPVESKSIIGPNLIPVGPGKGSRFKIGDQITVYEASMAAADRDPYPKMFGPYDTKERSERCLRLLILETPHAQHSREIFYELRDRIKRERITPIRIVRDRAGEIDFLATVIATADLVQLVKDRGERPRRLRRLLAKAAGDPASKRPLTQQGADKFAADYIANQKQTGELPTQTGLERAAKDAGHHGGREFLREAFKKKLGSQVKRGRPAKSAKK